MLERFKRRTVNWITRQTVPNINDILSTNCTCRAKDVEGRDRKKEEKWHVPTLSNSFRCHCQGADTRDAFDVAEVQSALIGRCRKLLSIIVYDRSSVFFTRTPPPSRITLADSPAACKRKTVFTSQPECARPNRMYIYALRDRIESPAEPVMTTSSYQFICGRDWRPDSGQLDIRGQWQLQPEV